MTAKNYRVMLKFWLDIVKPQEKDLADYCASLRQKRQFSSTIREALTLTRDLREKRLEVLFRLFPWVNEWLEDRANAIAEARLKDRDGGSNGDGPGGQVADKLNRIEQLLISNTTNSAGGLLSIARQNVKALPEPEPALTITKAKTDPRASTYNMLLSSAALNGMFDALPDEVLLYALDCGKVNRKQLKRSTLERVDLAAQHTVPMPAITAAPGIKQIAGSGKALPMPNFDEF